MDFSAYQLLLPESDARLIIDHSWRTFPRQACGLLFGKVSGHQLLVTAIPAENESPRHGMFLISPRQIIALARDRQWRSWSMCGCYHSHPRGAARPDRYDREFARQEGKWWIIYSNAKERLNAFYWNGRRFRVWRFNA